MGAATEIQAPNRARAKFLLDLVDLAGVFGEGNVIRYEDWAAKFYPGQRAHPKQGSTPGRSWERLKLRARRYYEAGMHTEIVPSYSDTQTDARGGVLDVVALKITAGSAARANAELDAAVVRSEVLRALSALRKQSSTEDTERVEDEVKRGLHRLVTCPTCEERPGLSCYDPEKNGTTFHLSRLRWAREIVCPACEEPSEIAGYCDPCGMYWSGE